MRLVVVGASSGLGRCLGVGLAQRGAHVALLARRQDNLERAAAEAGGDALPIVCDVTDETSCQTAIEKSVAGLGGIDAILYCAGVGVLRRIEDLDSKTWERVFATNVIGATQITRSALPHLRESHGLAAYLSSVSSSMTAPWPGLAAYAVTKAALDKLVEAWRAEHPDIAFTRIAAGECVGGEGDGGSQLVNSWDTDLAAELFQVWFERGLITDKLMDVDDLVNAVHNLLACGASVAIPTIAITPRRPI